MRISIEDESEKLNTDSTEAADTTENGNSEADNFKKIDKNDKDKLRKLLKWWPLPAYLLLVVILILFIKSGDEDDLYKAHFKEGAEVVTVGDTDYVILSREDKDHYIGSFVSDKLNAVSGDKIASVRSFLLYVSVFFEIQGDPEHNYLIDGKNTIYVRQDEFDEANAYFSDDSHINGYKMTAKMKDLASMNELTDEQMGMLLTLKGEEILVDDIIITENYETRREIYGFYDDGIFYKAVMELFKYDNEIYKTTMMINGKDNQGVSVLRGIKLPQEYQQEFLNIWD